MKRAVVVGGGAAGLSAALTLLDAGWRVRVFERAANLGGLASSLEVGGTTLERFYHHSFVGQDDILDMAERMGLGDRVIWGKTRMGFYAGGRVHPFGSPKDLLRFSPLPLLSRIRLGMSIAWFGRIRSWEPLDRHTARELLERWSGRRSFRLVWEPLLKLKYGDLADTVSAAWIWERVHSRRRSQKLGRGTESLGYIRGGSGQLLERLGDAVRAGGGEVRAGCPVERLLVEGGRCRGVRVDGGDVPGDAVVVTTPLGVLPRIAPDLPEDYLERLRRIRYQGALCVLVRLRRSLSPYYWINVADSSMAFAVVVEQTHLAPAGDYGGEIPVYLGSYLHPDHPWMSAPEEEVVEAYLADLFRVFPDLSADDVLGATLSREAFAQPVFQRGFAELRPEIRTPLANLFLATTAQSFPESRSVNTALRLGREAAEAAIAEDPDGLPGGADPHDPA